MSTRTFLMSEELNDYILSHWVREPQVLTRLREETAKMPNSNMQISADLGAFLRVLLPAIGARRTLEVGVFTGYSSTATALALPPEGRVIACDVSEEFTSVARRYWREAGVENKIELRLGPAVETLDAMLPAEENEFDFAFIDADKPNYLGYFDRAVRLVRPNGLIAVDNVLWSGRVLEADPDEGTRAIQEFNAAVGRDPRVEVSLVPVGDGLTLARVL